MQITDSDKDFITNLFPDLKFVESGSSIILRGKINFVARFVKKKKIYQILNLEPIRKKNKFLAHVQYEIEVDLSPGKNPYRNVRETNSRIINFALNELNQDPSSIHVYYKSPPVKDGTVCLWGWLDEESDPDVKDFVLHVVIPFFCDQKFFEQNRIWLRGEYSHGCLGILENYYDILKRNDVNTKKITEECTKTLIELAATNQDPHTWQNAKIFLRKKKIKSCWRCIRESKNKFDIHIREWSRFQDCHPVALKGIKLLHKNIRKYKLKHLL